MNLGHVALACLLSVGGYIFISKPGLDPMPVGAISSAPRGEAMPRYEISSNWQEGTCVLAVGAMAGDGKRYLHAEPGCSMAGIDIDAAAFWLERQDGSVAILDAEGSAAVEFSVGDGAAFESYLPAEPMITLISAD